MAISKTHEATVEDKLKAECLKDIICRLEPEVTPWRAAFEGRQARNAVIGRMDAPPVERVPMKPLTGSPLWRLCVYAWRRIRGEWRP